MENQEKQITATQDDNRKNTTQKMMSKNRHNKTPELNMFLVL